jgi:hypothetical protein
MSKLSVLKVILLKPFSQILFYHACIPRYIDSSIVYSSVIYNISSVFLDMKSKF